MDENVTSTNETRASKTENECLFLQFFPRTLTTLQPPFYSMTLSHRPKREIMRGTVHVKTPYGIFSGLNPEPLFRGIKCLYGVVGEKVWGCGVDSEPLGSRRAHEEP